MESLTYSALLLVASYFIYTYWQALTRFAAYCLGTGRSKTEDLVYKVFYQYNHNSPRDWVAWILSEDPFTQNRAFQQLKDHLDSSPEYWGIVTVEAVNAIAQLKPEESSNALSEFIHRLRKYWNDSPISNNILDSTVKQLSYLAPEEALNLIQSEFKTNTLPEKTATIFIDALLQSPPELDISEFIINSIINPNISVATRERLITLAHQRGEECAIHTYAEALGVFLDSRTTKLEASEEKIFSRLFLEACTLAKNDKTWKLVLQSCTEHHTQTVAANSLYLNILDKKIKFNNTQLYALYKIKNKSAKIIQAALSKKNSLTANEARIISEFDLLIKHQFSPDQALFQESLTDNLFVPEGLSSNFALVNSLLTKKNIDNEAGKSVRGGGVMLTGKGHSEKIYLTRAVASSRRWSFIYANIPMLASSDLNIERLIHTIQTTKPCIVFLDAPQALFSSAKNNDGLSHLLKILKQFTVDPLLFFVGSELDSFNKEAKSKEELPESLACMSRDIFPAIRELELCNANKKRDIFNSYINNLSQHRIQEQVSIEALIANTQDLYSLDFIIYLLEYLKISLLISGQMTSLEEYENLSKEYIT